jgi:hypothetical protein
MKVAFLAPCLSIQGSFYDVFTDILRCAASQLGVELDVIDCSHSAERLVDEGRRLAGTSHGPDYVLLPDYLGSGRTLLPILDEAGLRVFFVVECLTKGARATHGEPRQKHRNWLGEIVPTDLDAGYCLAKTLTSQARAQGARDGKIQVGILSGDQSTAGNARFQGWLRLLSAEPDVQQTSFQYAGWERGPAKSAAALMLRSHPEIGVIWAANDAMALGAVEAVREAGRAPGEEVLLGGVDLGHEALVAVDEGSLAVSIGGHCLDGARALILLHDHFKGRDFDPWSRPSSLVSVTAENVGRYRRLFEGRAWGSFDFSRFSRIKNPSLQQADFSIESLLPPGLAGPGSGDGVARVEPAP